MTNPEFFQTVMGRRFYEGTVPDLVRQLQRLNTNLEALVLHLAQQADDERQAAPDDEAEHR